MTLPSPRATHCPCSHVSREIPCMSPGLTLTPMPLASTACITAAVSTRAAPGRMPVLWSVRIICSRLAALWAAAMAITASGWPWRVRKFTSSPSTMWSALTANWFSPIPVTAARHSSNASSTRTHLTIMAAHMCSVMVRWWLSPLSAVPETKVRVIRTCSLRLMAAPLLPIS